MKRAERVLPGVEFVQGDLTDPASRAGAVRGAQAMVLTHGAGGAPESRRRIDHGGVRNLLAALDGSRPRVALMTSIYTTRYDMPGNTPWKWREERLVRACGLPYTVVGPAGSTGRAGPSAASSSISAARSTAASPAPRSPRHSYEPC